MELKRIPVGSLLTNCYIISNDKKMAFIVDPGDDVELIKDYIEKNNLIVKFVINTHSHVDHIKGDYDLGFPVYIHEADAPSLEDSSKNISSGLLGGFKPCKAAKRLKDNDVIMLDDLRIEVMHTPGHTPGCICLKIADIVLTGDTLFKGGIGRTDLPGGSYSQIISSIQNRLLCLDDKTKIYPGHGESSTIGNEKENF